MHCLILYHVVYYLLIALMQTIVKSKRHVMLCGGLGMVPCVWWNEAKVPDWELLLDCIVFVNKDMWPFLWQPRGFVVAVIGGNSWLSCQDNLCEHLYTVTSALLPGHYSHILWSLSNKEVLSCSHKSPSRLIIRWGHVVYLYSCCDGKFHVVYTWGTHWPFCKLI